MKSFTFTAITCKLFPAQVRKGASETRDHSGLGPRRGRSSDGQRECILRQALRAAAAVFLSPLRTGQCALRSALVRQENSRRESHLFRLASILPPLVLGEAHRRYVRGKRKSTLAPTPRYGLPAGAWLARLRVNHAPPRTPVLLPHFDRQALESQFAPLAARGVLRLC